MMKYNNIIIYSMHLLNEIIVPINTLSRKQKKHQDPHDLHKLSWNRVTNHDWLLWFREPQMHSLNKIHHYHHLAVPSIDEIKVDG